MEPIKLDGKELADSICKHLKYRVSMLLGKGVIPTLTIVTSGSDGASETYVKNKVRRAEEIGIKVDVRHYPKLDDWDISLLCAASSNPIIVQEPITGLINHNNVAELLPAAFDVDGFSDYNVAKIASGLEPLNYPCTPKGILRLLDYHDIALDGVRVCIIGRSNIVGRPLSWMMTNKNATVTLCNSFTSEKNLYNIIRDSDIVVSAVGQPEFLKKTRGDIVTGYGINWAAKTFVDVGINRLDGHLCGDIHPAIYEASYAYTPVPGGVGPMTVAMLMENVVRYYERIIYEGIKREG